MNPRSIWNIEKLRNLKKSLEKLINPSQNNTDTKFSIYLNANEFKKFDSEAISQGNDHEVVNGKINNFIFEKLDLKSTSIKTEIDNSGEVIKTELYDKGRFIYRMTEKNPYKDESFKLKNIKIHLFALNQSSKAMFTKYMGVRPVQFGSVFVYKNGFRIHPIGEIGRGDVFGLDGRKQQGTSRYFGTRDLIGRIEISGKNSEFREASSRDGGLERNIAFSSLKEYFITHALRRLERFAIGVVKYGNIDSFDLHDLTGAFPKEKALDFIETLTKGDSILDIKYNPEIFDIVSNASEQSLNTLLKNLRKIANESTSEDLNSEISKIEDRLSDFSKVAEDAEKEATKERLLRKAAEKSARVEAEKAREAEKKAQKEKEKSDLTTKQSLFLRSMISTELENVVALHHHIGIAAETIENYVRGVNKLIRSGKPVTTDYFLSVLDQISFVSRQISSTTKFATKANFNLEAEIIEKDLVSYINEYIENICSGLVKIDKDMNTDLIFNWNQDSDVEFILKFRPFEVAILLDGLINNSVKASAKNIFFDVSIEKNQLTLLVSDDGKGIKVPDPSQIFSMGYTTTKGSGLGLHHATTIMKAFKGSISISESLQKGATFKLVFKR